MYAVVKHIAALVSLLMSFDEHYKILNIIMGQDFHQPVNHPELHAYRQQMIRKG